MVHLTRTLRFFNQPGIKKLYYGMQGYNKYGLYRDDIYDYTNPVHLEALRRLPAEEYDRHVFRVVRASQLEFTKQALPEKERPSYEDDQTKGRFLQPYIQEVEREKKEKEEWLNFLAQD